MGSDPKIPTTGRQSFINQEDPSLPALKERTLNFVPKMEESSSSIGSEKAYGIQTGPEDTPEQDGSTRAREWLVNLSNVDYYINQVEGEIDRDYLAIFQKEQLLLRLQRAKRGLQ